MKKANITTCQCQARENGKNARGPHFLNLFDGPFFLFYVLNLLFPFRDKIWYYFSHFAALQPISPTFHKQLFSNKVIGTAFLYLHFVFVIFWWKGIGQKPVHKTLVKLTIQEWNLPKLVKQLMCQKLALSFWCRSAKVQQQSNLCKCYGLRIGPRIQHKRCWNRVAPFLPSAKLDFPV